MTIKKFITPFVRKRIRFFLFPLVLFSIVFISYQLLMFMRLLKDADSHNKHEHNLIRGIHLSQIAHYIPNERDIFQCIASFEEIMYSQVNDDYCDCLDGSDEPGTNACSNGQFFCAFQVKYKQHPTEIPSSRVNDGICDCCDGSDEWKDVSNIVLPGKYQVHAVLKLIVFTSSLVGPRTDRNCSVHVGIHNHVQVIFYFT